MTAKEKAAIRELLAALREYADETLIDETLPAIIKHQRDGRPLAGHEEKPWGMRVWQALAAVEKLSQ